MGKRLELQELVSNCGEETGTVGIGQYLRGRDLNCRNWSVPVGKGLELWELVSDCGEET